MQSQVLSRYMYNLLVCYFFICDQTCFKSVSLRLNDVECVSPSKNLFASICSVISFCMNLLGIYLHAYVKFILFPFSLI